MLLTLLAPALAGAVIAAAMVRLRLLRSPSVVQNGIRLGIVIAAIRVPLVGASALGFQYSDFRQEVGYILVMFNSFSEMLLAAPWRKGVWTWSVIVSGLVAVSSMVLGLALAALLHIIRRRRPLA